MASRVSYEFHHHFPKLAEESGFAFNVHRPRTHVDWHKIRSIDIESIVKERKFYIIEQHLSDIFNCVLEYEFDVRILDEGVIKMFRLAQLAVEYQQFCRHYLDRSVYVLREEITTLAQELDNTKKCLAEKDEEFRKFKKKTKYTSRPSLPFGNENIASMILKTLSNKSDIFGNPSTSNADNIQYNKCSFCDKVFLNQLYLKSHVNRRHSNMLDIPEKDITGNIQNTNEKDNSKLNDEIGALKDKLKEMECLLQKVNSERNTTIQLEEKVDAKPIESNKNIMKDAQVSTDTEFNILDKIEEWKKEEHDKYNKEINLLRTQIVDIINTFKSKEVEKTVRNDTNLIEELHATIKKQGEEMLSLKQELLNTRLKTEKEEEDRKKEAESQMTIWAKRVEMQAKQYEALVQKLNDVALEANEAKAEVESERSRAAHLQILLQESLTRKTNESKDSTPKSKAHITSNGNIKKTHVKRKSSKPKQEADPKTLENLHRKAQELLNMKSISSTDISSSSAENSPPEKVISKNNHHLKTVVAEKKNKEFAQANHHTQNTIYNIKPNKSSELSTQIENYEELKPKIRKERSKSHVVAQKIGNGVVLTPGSPMKLLRAKITEEVNNRLVNIGVDPLKNRLPKSYYKKQIMQLQLQHESKSKKTPEYLKIKHSILAYLDINAPQKDSKSTEIQHYVSPNRASKTFSLTSVISNVKNKALSLVKSNDTNIRTERKGINDDVAKKAMALLKTPPSSGHSSPVKKKTEEVRAKGNPYTLEKKRLSSQKVTDKDADFLVQRKNYGNYAEDDSSESDHKYTNTTIASKSLKSIDNLIKSPARRPSSASAVDYSGTVRKLTNENVDSGFLRSQSATNILNYKVEANGNANAALANHESSSDDLVSLDKSAFKTVKSDENIPKQTKSVLKNASSTSSLNKKKVLFDMDAIQMKSVSASPSQSITEKSDNEKFELGLVNLDGEEWDISSIENEPLKEDTKIQVNTRTSPKIAELKHTIESQLARRNETPSTAVIGGVDLLPAAMIRNSSVAGSNTSLGSSILDESESMPNLNNKAFVKTKKITDKDDSEIDISDYTMDGILNKKSIDSF